MTDAEAVRMLKLLRDYYREYGKDLPPPTELTVSELAGDLLDSIPRAEEIWMLEVLQPDSLTRQTNTIRFTGD